MQAVLSIARVLLALVFALAAAGKFIDRPGTRQALTDFGIPQRLTGVGSGLLPGAELAIAIALVPRPTARWGAVAAALLLGAFIIAIARVLRQGRTPDCHCFGQLHSAPATRSTLIRNAALLAIAVFVAWAGPGKAIDSQLAGLTTPEAALLTTSVLSLALAAASLWLWRQNRDLRGQLRRGGVSGGLPAMLPVGSPAPEFALLDENARQTTLQGLLADGHPLVLVFTSPHCGPCRSMMPDLARWQRALAHELAIVPVSTGSPTDDSRALAAEHGLSPTLIAPDLTVGESYAVPATPAAIAVAADGRIASRPATGAAAIEALIRVTLHRERAPEPAAGPTEADR
jgi:thiol-disulfide isomerase/thioredoxin